MTQWTILLFTTIFLLLGHDSNGQSDSLKTIKYRGKELHFIGRIGGLKALKSDTTVIFSYDTLNEYFPSENSRKNEIQYRIYINDKGKVVIKEKTKQYHSHDYYTRKGVRIHQKPSISHYPIGTWYYDNEGKLILKRKYKLPKMKKNEK